VMFWGPMVSAHLTTSDRLALEPPNNYSD
jgi:hypothetical protein